MIRGKGSSWNENFFPESSIRLSGNPWCVSHILTSCHAKGWEDACSGRLHVARWQTRYLQFQVLQKRESSTTVDLTTPWRDVVVCWRMWSMMQHVTNRAWWMITFPQLMKRPGSKERCEMCSIPIWMVLKWSSVFNNNESDGYWKHSNNNLKYVFKAQKANWIINYYHFCYSKHFPK